MLSLGRGWRPGDMMGVGGGMGARTQRKRFNTWEDLKKFPFSVLLEVLHVFPIFVDLILPTEPENFCYTQNLSTSKSI